MLLGIDIGTTGVKALLFDLSKKVYHLARRNYDLFFPEPNHVEQDPRQIWEATKHAIRQVVARAGGQVNITSISLSSQGGTLIPLDKDGDPLGNAIVWMDQRPREETLRLRERFGDNFFYLKTGWRLTGGLPLLQICWLRDKRPHFIEKVEKFAFVGDYIVYKLSEKWIIDPSSSAMTMLHNLRKGTWDEELLEIAGISKSQLPEIYNSGEAIGYISPNVMKELDLSGSNMMLSNGGHDQYCASLGAGAIEEGDLLLSGGTAWVLLLTLNSLIFDTKNYLSPGRHVIGDRWGLLSSVPSVGAGVDWFKTNWTYHVKGKYREEKLYDILEKKATEIPAGCDGLFFFPYFLGAGVQRGDTSLRAALLGLDLHHEPAHIFRALLEGIGFEVLWNIGAFKDLGFNISSVNMIGGATRSRIWPQMISDMLDLPIRVPRIQEAASAGATILAGLGAGVFRDCQEGAEQLGLDASYIHPFEHDAKRYKTLFLSYQKSFRKLREAFMEMESALS